MGQDLHKIEFKLSSYFYKIKISEKIAKISRETLGVLIKNFEAEGQEFATFFRSFEQFVQTVKGQNNFW